MFDKIVYFMDNYAMLGGAANTLLRQAVLMKHLGKDIRVAVSGYGTGVVCENYVNVCKKENIPVYELDYSVSNRPDKIDVFSVMKCYEKVKDFIKEQKPEIVHSVQLNPTVELACRELSVPHIMNIYQIMPEFFAFHYADIFAHYHICDSVYYASLWHWYLGTGSYCVRTVAKRGTRKKQDININSIQFICVGSLGEWKNQLQVIKAFELAVRNGINGRLQLWGHSNSDYANQCRKYIIDNRLQDYIKINGFSNDMEKIYQDSDVLICGSMNESYPNVISEALANDVIVVSTPVAGVPEVIKDRENGYLCKGYMAEDIAASIEAFHEDVKTGHIYRVLSNAGKTYETLHSHNAVTCQLMNAYEEILIDYETQKKSAYRIEDLEIEFKDTADRLLKHRNMLKNENFVITNIWKIYFVIKSLKEMTAGQQKRGYIWGTGKYGQLYKEILYLFAPDIKLTGFIDSYRTGQYMNYRIFSPDDIPDDKKNVILVGVSDNKDIIQILDRHGYQYGTDYFVFGEIPW